MRIVFITALSLMITAQAKAETCGIPKKLKISNNVVFEVTFVDGKTVKASGSEAGDQAFFASAIAGDLTLCVDDRGTITSISK